MNYLHRGRNGRLEGHVNRRGSELSTQNLVNGGAYRTLLPQSFHWDVGVMECASTNIHPLVSSLGWWWIQWLMIMGFVIQSAIYQLSWDLRVYIVKSLIEAKGKAWSKKQTYKTEKFSQCRISMVVVYLFLMMCVMSCMVQYIARRVCSEICFGPW